MSDPWKLPTASLPTSVWGPTPSTPRIVEMAREWTEAVVGSGRREVQVRREPPGRRVADGCQGYRPIRKASDAVTASSQPSPRPASVSR